MLWIVVLILTLVLIKLLNKFWSGWCYSRKVLTGKVAVVTGADSGIGFETALNLAKRGAKVILTCRDEAKGREAVEAIVNRTKNVYNSQQFITHKALDLSSFKSIRNFVENLKNSQTRVDILINNAETCSLQNTKTEDGLVYDLQVNYFGPFLLTTLMVPLLKKAEAARVINVSSEAHFYGKLDFESINKERNGLFDPWKVFADTKLYNLLFSNELARRLQDTDIAVNSLHPGLVNTSLFKHLPGKTAVSLINFGLAKFFKSSIESTLLKSSLEGAQTSIYLAVSEEVEGVTGRYFVDCKERAMSAVALDTDLAERLWKYSEMVTELGPEEKLK